MGLCCVITTMVVGKENRFRGVLLDESAIYGCCKAAGGEGESAVGMPWRP